MPVNLDRTRLEIFLAIGSKLNSTEKLGELLQEIADAAADLTQSQGSSILLFEEETQQLYFVAARAANREHLMQIRVPIDKSVAGWVYDQGSPMNITDASIDPLLFRTVEQSLEIPTRNLLAIPITFGNETLGTLEVINKFGEQDYTTDDQASLDILASLAGTAIQLKNLLEKADDVSHEREELNKQKSDFIAITSHELRTPLGLILGHSTFLNEITQEEFHKEQLNAIIVNAERLKDIIDGLSQVKIFESGTARLRWQKTDLNRLLDSVVNTFQDLAQEREMSLGVTIPEKAIYIHCDAAKLSVAIGNIIKNGLIFSDEGQKVRVGLHQLPGHAHISIVDSGIGIPADDFQLIFERFYQVEPHLTRTRGGMGLGLSVSKSIVESHGGYIWVESILGEGSTFTILLPTKDPTE
jgi:signal transduction histidine kinase